jgi:SAM-dependent methyltransferase
MVASFNAALASVLPTEADRVLDVGCGEGHHLDDVARAIPGATTVGLDAADPAWLAAWHPPGARIVVGDAVALPFGDGTIDLVLALEVLEHLPDPRTALAEIARVTSGQVILSVPWEPVWRAGNLARGRYVRDWGNTPGHLQHFTRRAFRRIIEDHFDIDVVRRPLPWTLVRARPRR